MSGETHHASAVVLDGRAIMLTGPSGSGKSSLTLSLIDAYGAQLVGDDRIVLRANATAIEVAPHERLAGLLELRGLGFVRLPYLVTAPLGLVVQLSDTQPRLADPAYFHFGDRRVPMVTLNGHDPMTALRIKYAARALQNGFHHDAIYPLD